MFSAETSAVVIAEVTRKRIHAGCMAVDITSCKVRVAQVRLSLGAISQVTLISLVTLDALSHASYAYDAYECTFPLSLVSAGQVVSPERHLPVG